VFNGSEQVFIFVHYFLIFILLFSSLVSLSKRYYVILIIAYFFLAPVSIDSIFHIWRQQIASSVFLIGTILFFIKNNKKGLYLILLSPLLHLVCFFFVLIFLLFNFLRKKNIINTSFKLVIYAMILSCIFILIFQLGITFLASFNLDRLLFYAEDSGSDQLRLLIVLCIMMSTMIYTQVKHNNDDFNQLIIFISFIVTSMSVAFPNASSIFGRLAYFTVPLIALYFARWFIINIKKKHFTVFVFLMFLSGLYRIIPMIIEKRASVQFLAFNHALDPFMGVLKLFFL
jgi:hypothetical protein